MRNNEIYVNISLLWFLSVGIKIMVTQKCVILSEISESHIRNNRIYLVYYVDIPICGDHILSSYYDQIFSKGKKTIIIYTYILTNRTHSWNIVWYICVYYTLHVIL